MSCVCSTRQGSVCAQAAPRRPGRRCQRERAQQTHTVRTPRARRTMASRHAPPSTQHTAQQRAAQRAAHTRTPAAERVAGKVERRQWRLEQVERGEDEPPVLDDARDVHGERARAADEHEDRLRRRWRACARACVRGGVFVWCVWCVWCVWLLVAWAAECPLTQGAATACFARRQQQQQQKRQQQQQQRRLTHSIHTRAHAPG
jgi:hypothetical protein